MSVWAVSCRLCPWAGSASRKADAVQFGMDHSEEKHDGEPDLRVRSVVRIDELRKEGAADAVVRIVAAKTLLSPYTRADDLARAVGVTRGDLREALERLKEDAGRKDPASR